MTDIPTPPSSMTLIYAKDQYSSKIKAFCLVRNEQEATAIKALIDQTGAKAEAVDVPVWPHFKSEEI